MAKRLCPKRKSSLHAEELLLIWLRAMWGKGEGFWAQRWVEKEAGKALGSGITSSASPHDSF